MSRADPLDAFVDPLFFETIDRYEVVEDDFLSSVESWLTGHWTYTRRGVWFNATPPEDRARDLPIQGWKIHVSSNITDGLEILRAVVPLLDERNVNFKFALDQRILSMMNSKTWGRQGAGKFITIYPVDTEEFVRLLEALHPLTKTFEGLYILSDRRYKDSKVLFYRYGGIRHFAVANERGEEVGMLVSPTGEKVPDERKPIFYSPPWAQDPFEEEHSAEPGDFQDEHGRIALKGGRYLVKNVLGFSNSGGVYIADDIESGEEVVIKEARPFVTFTKDSISLLEKEHRIMRRLAEAGAEIAPRPIDFFRDWEHYFLVQEYIQGIQLTSFSASRNVTLMTDPKLEDTLSFYEEFQRIFIELARVIQALHEHDIVFSDLSPNNVIVLTDPLRVRIIDFEGAVEVGVDEHSYLYTPGFAYGDQMYGAKSSFEADYFSLGALMHYFLAPFNQIFVIAPRLRFKFIKAVFRDIGFPMAVHDMIAALIENDADKRPRPEQVIEILEEEHELQPPSFEVYDESENAGFLRNVERIGDYCLALADYERKDRLFPAYGSVFHTNPLSWSYGACGVAHALQFVGRDLPDRLLDWIVQPTDNPDSYAPGLYVGLSGIAWTVLDLGRVNVAKRILARSLDHPLAWKTHDLFHGTAGWGMANLKFFLELEDESYRDNAIKAGEHLLSTARDRDGSLFWKDDDQTPVGLAHGASGVALFLLYLYQETEQVGFLEAGIRALDFDLGLAQTTRDGGLSWRRHDDERPIVYPYWRFGSAGIGVTVVRYLHVLGDERYRELAGKIFLDLDRKYAVFPGLFQGLTGIGETLLDFHHFMGEKRFLRAAYRVATGLSLFRIDRDEGLAYPGDGLNKICCDLATGSAGVARFFHRLVHHGRAPLLLDSLLENQNGSPTARSGAN